MTALGASRTKSSFGRASIQSVERPQRDNDHHIEVAGHEFPWQMYQAKLTSCYVATVAKVPCKSQRRRQTMRCILCVLLMMLLTPNVDAALPGDSADGKRLHDANCMGCHDTGIYTRKDRVVQSLDALRQQLEGCTHMAKREFSAIETRNIIKYLNDQFYQFP
jgi:hypothetical protein